jgi:Transposase DDE domain
VDGMGELMLCSAVFEKFVSRSPISVMARATMEHALTADSINALFVEHADEQYTRKLLFSSVVDLMSVVVSRIQPSVNAAFIAVSGTLPVSLTALYEKLNGVEPQVTSALVQHAACRLAPVVACMGGRLPDLVPGYRVRILDGNHLAATERRLQVLRGSIAGPLPGHAIVVMDPASMLVTHMIPCEDGHAQERSLTGEILALVEANDVMVADRNFCTTRLLFGIAKQEAFFVIRHHANLTLVGSGTRRRRGRTDTGQVFEQCVTIVDPTGKKMALRGIILQLDAPTRDGDTEMSILTNLPAAAANAIAIANVYSKRWTLETLFQALTQMLDGEINSLGYPRAALLGFGIALVTYNILSTVQAALRGAFGVEKVQAEVSGYYIANEVRGTALGMGIAIDDGEWKPFEVMAHTQFARQMLRWASGVQLARLKRHPRGPKKPVPKRTRFPDDTHVSTFRLLAKAREKRP